MDKRLFIVDTDPGIDDARSLAFLLSLPDVEVLAVTTVAGNGFNVQTSANARTVLECAEANGIPVYQGSRYNLLGDVLGGDGYHGNDGLGDIHLPAPSSKARSDMSSWEALLHYSKRHPGEITLVALGPLTNLALGFMHDYKFPKRFRKIFVMGSDSHPHTFANMTRYAEFNTYCDPVAASLVYKNFRSTDEEPIYLADWYLCWQNPLPADTFERVVAACEKHDRKKNVAKVFAARGDETASTNYSLKATVEGILVSDEFATVSAYDESVIEDSELCRVSVSLEGQRQGHTRFAPCDGGNVRLIKKVNMEKLVGLFVSAFEN